MKIDKVTCWVLKLPFNYPLLKKADYATANFVEIETDDGIKGHAMSEYPMAHGIREFINRDVAPTIIGMDPMRIESIHTALFWQRPKFVTGSFACSASLIDIALWDI